MNLIKVAPLKNGKPTEPVPANALNESVYFPDGTTVTLGEVVKNNHIYNGKKVSASEDTTTPESQCLITVNNGNVYITTPSKNLHLNPEFDLGDQDLTKDPAALQAMINSTVHVLKSKMLTMTELSVVYGPSGSGKTLVTLAEIIGAIQAGSLRGANAVYANLDDSAIGIFEKSKILASYNIKMIKEFTIGMLDELISQGIAKGKIIIVDTVKKIVNLQDKAEVKRLMISLKRFTHAGGTAILIAHANKHLGLDGKPILEGVGDLKNDADCVVSVQRHGDIITMTNEKQRSYVELEAIFQTADTKDYGSLLQSLKQLTGDEAEALKTRMEQEKFKAGNKVLIQKAIDIIGSGEIQKTTLVNNLVQDTGLARKPIIDTLELLEGDLWEMKKGDNNSKNYSLL